MKDNRSFREIQAALRWAGIESRKYNGRDCLRVRAPISDRKYSLTVGNLGNGWIVELEQPGQLDEDYQAVREEVAAFRYRVQIAIDSSRMDEGESPAIESPAGENEESNPAGRQLPEVLQRESLGGITPTNGEAPGEDAIASIEEDAIASIEEDAIASIDEESPGSLFLESVKATCQEQGWNLNRTGENHFDIILNPDDEGAPGEEDAIIGEEDYSHGPIVDDPELRRQWLLSLQEGSTVVFLQPGEEAKSGFVSRMEGGTLLVEVNKETFRVSRSTGRGIWGYFIIPSEPLDFDAIAGDEAPGEEEAIAPDPIEEIKEKVSLTERISVKCVQIGIEVAGACRLATGKSLLQCSVAELNLFLKRITGLAEWIGGIDDPVPAANDYGQQFITQFLRDGQIDEDAISSLPDQYEGEECPECKGKGHLSPKEYWDEECQLSFPEDEEAWCRKCYGSGIFPPPQRLAATVEDCLFRRAQKVAHELGFQYLARENKHMIIRENFIEAYSTAEGAIEGMREAVLIDAEKTLLKAAIDSLCYEMAMTKLPANNICTAVTGNTIEDCSVNDLKIFLNHLRYIEKVALGSHQDNRHTG